MIDFKIFNEYMDNDEELIVAVLLTYIEDYADGIEQLNNHYQNQDWSQLHLLAHSLKGILASFGEEKTVASLEKIEHSAYSNKQPDILEMQIVQKELKLINQQIEEKIEAFS